MTKSTPSPLRNPPGSAPVEYDQIARLQSLASSGLNLLITLPFFSVSEEICEVHSKPFGLNIPFSWEILDKFDKLGTLYLIILFNKSLLLSECVKLLGEWPTVYEGPVKSFVTGFGLLQCYVLSNIFLIQTFKVFPLY